MAQGFNQLVSALEARFDYQSARIMAREALGAAGLTEKGDYGADEVQQFVDGLNGISKHLDAIWLKLGVAPSGQDMPEPPPAPEPEPEPEPEAPAEEASSDEVPEE